ncbi:pleckstrin homology domain-containing family M member 3-like [Acipenser ruthenus]|uniref:pleckstrin homology domain-containing family M member 3-like n=1 Tax=Acipenser ruthenus TaxID=7906 RepID=UPI00145ACF32|nr:pleckstrin homology domain-containing family M member 3-like [Acipenser ruthenus]XP_058888555.1 pleckstrin homology domain-containing family M member 3-like [Acipenser ruthenus]
MDVEDISPALEVTEDFLHCFDCPVENGQQQQQQHENYSIQEVPELAGQKGFMSKAGKTHAVELRNSSLQSNGGTFWGLLSKEQLNKGCDAAANNLEWAEKKEVPSFNIFSMCQGRRSRSRARSTNDLASQAKESAAFTRGHNRSRSDANYKSVPDNGVPSLERNLAAVSDLQRKEAFPNIVKKGYLEQREGVGSRWSSCYIELSPCELRIYSLDSSGNQQLCTAYSLSHCHSVVATNNQDAKIVDAVFFNNTRLQLRAQSQWEALDWEQRLLERISAVRPAPQEDKPTTQAPRQLSRPTALPLFTQHCQDVLKTGVLYQLTNQNNWQAFTFVLSKSHLVAFPTEGRGPVSDPLFRYNIGTCVAVQRDVSGGCVSRFQVIFPEEGLCLRAESENKTLDWAEAIRVAAALQKASGQPSHVTLRGKPAKNPQRSKRQSVTTSFLGILTTLAVEKGLTAQSFRCAGCQRPVGLSRGRAKVCCYSGLYYCQSCHEDDVFLIPARLVHNWDTRKHKVSKQAKEFLEFVLEEPLIDIQLQNPCLYAHVDSLAAALRLRQQLKSLRAYLFSCRAGVAEDLRRRIFPREYLLQHIHLYSLSDLQQVIEGKLSPFLSKVIKFASSHVYSCSLCSQKGFICEICQNGQVIYPFQDTATKRCEGCGAVFHAECRSKAQPCPRCVRREMHKKPRSFWRKLNLDESAEDSWNFFEMPFQST